MEPKEMMQKDLENYICKKRKLIDIAAGKTKADLVLKNAQYVNVFSQEIGNGDIAVSDGVIAGIGQYDGVAEIDASGRIVIPGLTDPHIHLESSLVKPEEFARAVIAHGTTTVIVDPHEITNVMGIDGIRYMLEATECIPVDVEIMLPSCVPATPLDESGAVVCAEELAPFYTHPRVRGLAEMMNYVGVIQGDKEVLSKIIAAQNRQKRIDGHAPCLSGKELNAYIASGVYSDHECDTLENALEKLRLGQYIMIREGTAAKNLNALVPLLLNENYADCCMFASDDMHPNDLLRLGHLDAIIKKAITLGVNPITAVRAATWNVVRYARINDKGAIAPGFAADFAILNNLTDFHVETVIKNGTVVYANGKTAPFQASVSEKLERKSRSSFHMKETTAADFFAKKLAVIGIIPNEIVTDHLGYADRIDLNHDILKIAVVERHHDTGHIGIGYVKGYGLKAGAIATSVAHDSHNIIVVGTSDEDISFAVNKIKEFGGGITVVKNGEVLSSLPLPVAGLMSDLPLETVNEMLEATKAAAYSLGVSNRIEPFMTLSFMSLPVIPKLKVTTKGVFDVEKWQYC